MAEFKTEKQNNYGFPLTFAATGKFPVIAKRLWKTYADALDFIENDPTACAGIIISVFRDPDKSKNGVYQVLESEEEPGKLKLNQIGGGNKQEDTSNIFSKRLWKTYADALNYIETDKNIVAGIIISVFKDPDKSKNGVYQVLESEEEQGKFILNQIGGGYKQEDSIDISEISGKINALEENIIKLYAWETYSEIIQEGSN